MVYQALAFFQRLRGAHHRVAHHPLGAILVSVSLLTSCQPDTADVREHAARADVRMWRIADGQTVGDLLASPNSILLIYSPSECFSCTGTLQRWMELAGRCEIPAPLVLTRNPSTTEATALALLRVPIAGVLNTPPADPTYSSVHIYRDDSETRSVAGTPAQLTLLDELATPSSTSPQDRNSPNSSTGGYCP